MSYQKFLEAKAVTAPLRGLSEVPTLASHLFPFQRACVEFGLRAGSWGLFLDTGLGKTACELEWCRHAAEASNGRALILTPLAVARQIEREGLRWGYQIRVIREQNEAGEGINVCNYDRLDKLAVDTFGAIALDESSILKALYGKTTRALVAAFQRHCWRMAATATPAPNDHTELGNHSDFLGIMPQSEMLIRWFINDSGDASKTWRLKGHAVSAFWDWMASWCRMAGHPRDLGDDVPGFDLPAMVVHRHHVEAGVTGSGLFGADAVSATGLHALKRQTADVRARIAADIVNSGEGPCVVWVDTDYEADAVARALPCAREVRGSHPIERKERDLAAFADGECSVLLSKPSICGHGLNWQFCSRMVFVGRSFSYESWYQAVRRCWRFGQTRPVDVHVVVAEGEDAIGRVIDRKAGDHERMKLEMVSAMLRAVGRDRLARVPYLPTHEGRLPSWL